LSLNQYLNADSERGGSAVLSRESASDDSVSNAQRRKQEIVAATIRVIERRGVSGASMRVIAQEMGLTTGVITHYFADKSQLMLAVLQTCFAPWSEIVEDGRELAGPWERLRHLFMSTLPTYHQPRARVQVWLTMLQQLEREAELWQAYKQNYDLLREEVFSLIRECQASEIIRSDLDPIMEGNRLFALSDGLAVSVLGEPEMYPLDVLERIMDSQFDAMRTAQ
jgi:AcrR family transcriptional regulator